MNDVTLGSVSRTKKHENVSQNPKIWNIHIKKINTNTIKVIGDIKDHYPIILKCLVVCVKLCLCKRQLPLFDAEADEVQIL
jgi:hypothetical protein